MKTKYDLMKNSNTKDSKGSFYPDVLSLNLKNLSFNQKLTKVELDQRYVKKPYLLAYDAYGECKFDDLLYMINGVSYTDELVIGEPILVPSLDDMNKFYADRVVLNQE